MTVWCARVKITGYVQWIMIDSCAYFRVGFILLLEIVKTWLNNSQDHLKVLLFWQCQSEKVFSKTLYKAMLKGKNDATES